MQMASLVFAPATPCPQPSLQLRMDFMRALLAAKGEWKEVFDITTPEPEETPPSIDVGDTGSSSD